MGLLESVVSQFNEEMYIEDSIVRLYLDSDGIINIRLISDHYIKSEEPIHLEDEFYGKLESFFKIYGLSISYNNIKSCFWVNK